MESSNQAIYFGEENWTNMPMINAVLNPVTGKEIQYKEITKHPDLGPLYKIGMGKKLGRLFQGIRDIKGTNTYFFIDLVDIPKDRKITYENLCAILNHKKWRKN